MSTEDALHNLVTKIEKAIQQKEIVCVHFSTLKELSTILPTVQLSELADKKGLRSLPQDGYTQCSHHELLRQELETALS